MSDIKKNIQQTLHAFDDGPFFDNAIAFFNALAYNTERQNRLSGNLFKDFKDSFIDTDDHFNEGKALSEEWNTVELLFQLTNEEITQQIDIFSTDQVDDTIIESYLFFAIELKGNNYSRTKLAQITREVNKLFSMPALILFKYSDKLTLSIINRRLHKRDSTKDVLEKVTLIKDIRTSNPHRAHIEILSELHFDFLNSEGEITSFIKLHKAWLKTLDLKELNERFYNEISTWYYIALQNIKLPIKPDYYKDDTENVKYFTVRLICRLIFTWFLKEQRLIDKSLLEIDESTIDKIVKNSKEFGKQNSYYRTILQNIFFSSLNTIAKERKSLFGENNLADGFDNSLFTKIPYLNGGLFDKLEEDNCNDRIEDGAIRIPNELFIADKLTITVDRKTLKTKGLNRILEQYKFTVDENTPLEEEVALDPELLGLVFEKLLAEIDPNDAIPKSARKATGSFYTPRKVIDYMVNESLLLYLKNNFKTKNYPVDGLEELVYYNLYNESDTIFSQHVVESLDEIKIIDPACGSGAFPMGMLHKMVSILGSIDPDNNLWIDIQLEKLPVEMREQMRKDLNRHELNYARKLGIIRNSIYGIDIQPLAVMITKLRFFISLLIEQDIDLDDAEHNYHIAPLPNLETKIICANSLKDSAEQLDLFKEQAIQELIDIKEEYYQNQSLTEADKEILLTKITDTLHSVYPDFARQITGKKLPDAASEELRNKKYINEWFKHANLSAPFFSMKIFFPELQGSGFDIVIGNPPYGGDKIPDDVKNNLNLGSKDPYGAFIARFLTAGNKQSPLKHRGILTYIVSDTFMTIKSHKPLRKQMMDNYIHKMIRVHPDTFKATVNTAIILCERNVFPKNKDGHSERVFDENHKMLVADLTNTGIHENYDRFLELLYRTTEAELQEYIEEEGDKLPVLRMSGEDWTSESSEEYAIYTYPQTLINTNSNQPFFVASPKLFNLLDEVSNKSIVNSQFIYENSINKSKMKFSKFGDEYIGNGKDKLWKKNGLFKVISGIKSGANSKYLKCIGEAQKKFISIDKKLFLENNLMISDNEKSNGIKGKKHYIRFEMGMPSNADGGILPCYYQDLSNIVIDWSTTSVTSMKIEKHSDLANEEFRFREINKQISFSFTGQYAPTFRIANAPIFLNASSRIFFETTNDRNSWLGFLNSLFVRFLNRNYINHTVNFGVDDLKTIMVPTKIPKKLTDHVNEIINTQKYNRNYDYASHEQIEIDRLVYDSYGLNEKDIQEVENWYARRYPRLVKAQRANLARLQSQKTNTNA